MNLIGGNLLQRKLRKTLGVIAFLIPVLPLTTTVVHAQIPNPAVVYAFQQEPTDIITPSGLLAQGRDGNIYGTGTNRGANNKGGIYKISPSGVETVVVSFPSTYASCQGLTLAFDGNFYGTCLVGGGHGYGFIFQATPAGVLTDIYDFTATNDDGNPDLVPVLGANGDLYGTSGNTNYICGNIYRIAINGTGYKNIKSGPGFCSPSELSAGSDGNFYGIWGNTPTAGNVGAVFKVSGAGGYTEIKDFSAQTDPSWYPTTGPILATNGKLYGTDDGGGTNSNGAIYSLTTNGKTVTDLFNINSSADGTLWGNNLFQASDGNFYGASYSGGSGNQGSFFELTSKNVFSVDLIITNNTIGDNPATPIMQHTNGLLYGTTSVNGANGAYGNLLSFNIGASPFVALVGPVAAGTEGSTVQILGQDFSSSSVVEFGGTPSTSVQVSGSTFIEATVPAGALTGKITVSTTAGTLSSLVTFKVTPKLASFTPTSGPVGTGVTITGSGLEQTTSVKFNGTKASFTVDSDSQISATVPTGATTGKITVTTKGGSATSSSSFTVN